MLALMYLIKFPLLKKWMWQNGKIQINEFSLTKEEWALQPHREFVPNGQIISQNSSFFSFYEKMYLSNGDSTLLPNGISLWYLYFYYMPTPSLNLPYKVFFMAQYFFPIPKYIFGTLKTMVIYRMSCFKTFALPSKITVKPWCNFVKALW